MLGHLSKQGTAPWDTHSANPSVPGQAGTSHPQTALLSPPHPHHAGSALAPLAWQSSAINVVLYPNGQKLLREGITT